MSESDIADVAIVGAGMVGLSTAWFLQTHGVRVTVFDEATAGSGASWGNAGWVAPSLSTPLTDPAMLVHGLRGLLRPNSPLFIPPRVDPGLWRFLLRFARHSTPARWRAGLRSLLGVNALALPAFDALAAGGVDGPIAEADPLVYAYADPSGAAAMVAEAQRLTELGQRVDVEPLALDQARRLAPILSDRVRSTLSLHGQRFLDPPRYTAALADSVVRRGGVLRERWPVREVAAEGNGVRVHGRRYSERFDAVVIANGVALPALARRHGVRTAVRAARGYSFSVAVDELPSGPVYFPACSVVATPIGERLRLAGTMEFRAHRAPLDPRRITAIVESVRPLLRGVHLDRRTEAWVGSRPSTSDGLPLAGRTRTPGVFVAGGHAMEGMTLGPVTGRLLAEAIVTGVTPAALAGFDPLR